MFTKQVTTRVTTTRSNEWNIGHGLIFENHRLEANVSRP